MNQEPMMTVEIALRGGTLVDGSGAKPRRADVGVSGGRIIEIGEKVPGKQELDASGQLVMPGFIDIHTHYDPQVLWDPMLTPSCWHGVTSVVAGNCGYSIAPTRPADRQSLFRTLDKVEDMRTETLEAGVRWEFETYPEYLKCVERTGTLLNFGGFVGHTPVRTYVMGTEAYDREATPTEMAQMSQLVADSISGGALGFSSDRAGSHVGDGGRPVPSVVSSRHELESLMSVTRELQRGIVHVAPGDEVDWLYEFAPSLGRPVTWTSLLSFRDEPDNPHPYRKKLATHRVAWQSGIQAVRPQVSCRPITTEWSALEPTPFYRVPAFAEIAGRSPADRINLYRDRDWRRRAYDQISSGEYVDARWDNFAVADSPTRPDWIGRRIVDLSAESGIDEFDIVCDLVVADAGRSRFRVTFANDDIETVSELLSTAGCVLGLSDAGAHVSQMCDAVMPTDFLANWVRDRSLMPLEQGVRKLTGELADILQINRGYVKVGSPADLVVLDLENLSIGPLRRVRDLPAEGERIVADDPAGITHTLVNGIPIRTDGVMSDLRGSLPGALLTSTI